MPTLYQRQGGRWLRVAISLMVLVTGIRVWIGPVAVLERVQAQIPDSGMQRKLILEEARMTTQLLRSIKELLENHTFNVKIEGADNQGRGPRKTRSGG